MNKPVAWMFRGYLYEKDPSDWTVHEHPNVPVIPLYTNPVKEQSNLVKVVQDHVKDLKRCVKVFRTQLLNNTANEMEVAIKELEDALESHPVKVNYDFNSSQVKELTDEEMALRSLYEAIIRYENLAPFADSYAVESCEYQLHDAKEKAKAILRKAQKK